MGYKWKPLQRAEWLGNYPASFVQEQMKESGSSYEDALAGLRAYDATTEVWKNDLYQVQTRKFVCEAFGGVEMVHINIRRCDGAAIFDWRHRQRIKNQLVGPECEAFEIYPAESRLVDTSNKYHLWAFTDPSVRLPVSIGYEGRREVVEEEVRSPPGMRQRAV